MNEEIWKPIPGAHGYEASSEGNIRSVDRRVPSSYNSERLARGVLLSPALLPSGHLHVEISGVTRTVHSLVAETFLGEMPAGMEVRHLDGNPANNQIENLAYGTRSENTYDRVAHGTHHFAARECCAKGHAYTEENTYTRGGHRHCRTCSRERNREYYKRRKSGETGSARTHCKRGHEFTEENTYTQPSKPNARQCRQCIAIRRNHLG